MSDAYADIGAAEALSVLAEAQAIGQTFKLWHRANDPVTLYGVINDLRLGSGFPQAGRMIERGEIQLLIPNQTGFVADISGDVKPITKGDKIEYKVDSGRFFFVNEDAELIANGYIYKVYATERRTNTLGNRS